jgi:UDP-N-acetylmuramoyl-L-alanyl-D-glutamate--2,6-diaminopimelate ligase
VPVLESLRLPPPTPELDLGRPLAQLVRSLPIGADVIPGEHDRDPRIRDVTYRSADVRPGSLFFCVPGDHVDGHTFAPDAAAAGAAALVVERALPRSSIEPAAQVVVPSVRRAMGPISAAFFGRPADRMSIVGVTGTNGKTTTTYLLESVFRAAGHVPGVIGTTGARVDARPVPFERTTPEAPDLQRLLGRMADDGVTAVAMEVSSHGLDQHRVDGTAFACALFTNLSQDHLDYHPTMEAYFLAKARLFTQELSWAGAANADSEEGRRLLEDAPIPTLSFGLRPGADLVATDVEVTGEGIRFRVDDVEVRSRLRALFNVYNCLGAFAAARQLEVEDRAVIDGIAALAGVPGRLEPVDAGQPFAVLVDYAHTPDSLQNVLRAARGLAGGRVIAVFGCGGDRDRGKRPLMGQAATSLADLTVITSDNPRSEEPGSIIAEIEPGARAGGGPFAVEPDRRLAIRMALSEARAGDVVVIAGKGHETGQRFADRTVPFDDRRVAAEEVVAIFGEPGP